MAMVIMLLKTMSWIPWVGGSRVPPVISTVHGPIHTMRERSKEKQEACFLVHFQIPSVWMSLKSTCKLKSEKKVFEPATFWVRDQDATIAPGRHR